MNWEDLINRRNVWVAHNFPDNPIPQPGESMLGLVEELGELAHAHLKELQNIRGTPEEHQANAKDAIGDLTVYLLGVMSFRGRSPKTVERIVAAKPEIALFELAQCVGELVNSSPRVISIAQCEYVIEWAQAYCISRGWDYEQIVMDTWNEVEKRDWKLYPLTGLPNVVIES